MSPPRPWFAPLLIALALCGWTSARATELPPPGSDAEFCVRAQRTMAGTQMTASNVVHPDYESFKESKASIQPLRTEQFVLYEDEGKQTPLRISCKLKSPDLIAEVYGAAAAQDPGLSCAHLHQQIVEEVFASLTVDERARLAIERVVYEPDEATFMGSSWIEPYDFAWRTDDGALHLKAKRLRVDWKDARFAWAPDRVRGVIYCHLIAPEHFRRLATAVASN